MAAVYVFCSVALHLFFSAALPPRCLSLYPSPLSLSLCVSLCPQLLGSHRSGLLCGDGSDASTRAGTSVNVLMLGD